MSMPKVRDSPYSVDTTPTRVTTIDPYFQFKELTRVYKVEKTFKQTRGNLIQIESCLRGQTASSCLNGETASSLLHAKSVSSILRAETASKHATREECVKLPTRWDRVKANSTVWRPHGSKKGTKAAELNKQSIGFHCETTSSLLRGETKSTQSHRRSNSPRCKYKCFELISLAKD